jgi:hypothetical protein
LFCPTGWPISRNHELRLAKAAMQSCGIKLVQGLFSMCMQSILLYKLQYSLVLLTHIKEMIEDASRPTVLECHHHSLAKWLKEQDGLLGQLLTLGI